MFGLFKRKPPADPVVTDRLKAWVTEAFQARHSARNVHRTGIPSARPVNNLAIPLNGMQAEIDISDAVLKVQLVAQFVHADSGGQKPRLTVIERPCLERGIGDARLALGHAQNALTCPHAEIAGHAYA